METAMRSLTDQLAHYAAYHRDRRNIATHFIGIPLIVVAVATLLARPAVQFGGWPLSVATVVTLLTVLYYLRLDLRFGAAMAVVMGAALALGQTLAAQSTAVWLAAGIGLFVVGWVIQFVGHVYERRKPAFVDDLIGLIIGPLFVVTEAAFALGLRPELLQEIERRAGPIRGGTAQPSRL
jgi:uncharacterized membrane protein YGL010W